METATTTVTTTTTTITTTTTTAPDVFPLNIQTILETEY